MTFRPRLLPTAALVGLFAAAAAAAGEVSVSANLSSVTARVNEEVVLTVSVRDAQVVKTPVIPRVSTMDIQLVGLPSRASGMNIINGRVEQWNEWTYRFSIIPKKMGRLSVPGVRVTADNKEYRTSPLTLVVGRGDSGRPLIVEIDTGLHEAYVEQPVRATLRVWLRVYRQDDLTLNPRQTWSIVDTRASDFGVFGEPAYVDMRVREDGDGNAASYYVYEKEGVIYPEQPGPLKLSDVRVIVNYPQFLSQSIFGELQMTRSQRLVGVPGSVNITVKPLPDEDRPADFNGAVGRFTIADSATPRDVSVGDPITLTLEIRGQGRLDRISAPLLARVDALSRDFKIPDEPLAGKIQGDAKVFTQTIRAASDSVHEIPPIPFSYFDPEKARFETAYSEPIPLKVRAASSLALSQVVEAEPVRPRPAKPIVERNEGLLANYVDDGELLQSQRIQFDWPWAAAGLGFPLAYVGLVVVQRRNDRIAGDSAYRRRTRAESEARRRLAAAAAATPASAAASQIAAALTGYLADRLNLRGEAMTRDDARRVLAEKSVNPALAADIDGLLADVELAQFAGLAAAPAADLVDRAARCLERLESERLR